MIDRLGTGIPGLDKILKGGIPFETNVIVIGRPGTGKSTFCYQVTKSGLKKDLSCLFITTVGPPRDVYEALEELGFDVKKNKKLVFIDCYSSRLGKFNSKVDTADPSDLNTLSLKIDKKLKSLDNNSLVIFDCLSEILLKNDPSRVSKFLSVLGAKIKSKDCIGIFTIVDEMHDEKIITSIEFLCDGTIEMTVENNKRFIKVDRMKTTLHPLEKFEFDIKRKGIALKELEDFFEH